MTPARTIEHGIARQLQRRRERETVRRSSARTQERSCMRQPFDVQPWADRVIAILAVATGLLLIGSYVEELLWVILAAAAVYSLR